LFVYKAYKEQRLSNVAATEANRDMKDAEAQHLYTEWVSQFDGNFKTLLELYQDSVQGYKHDGLDAGKVSMSTMVSEYIKNKSFENQEGYTKRSIAASTLFEVFLNEHRTVVNAHMRLFFQILRLLEDTDIDESDKVIYAKTLRSQLTDEELILIRYNCLTKRGQKMQLPVFHYNIMKHLPLFDLFEFKRFRTDLDQNEINLVNDEFIYLRKEICSLFRIQSISQKTVSKQYSKRYGLTITASRDNKQYSFSIERNPKQLGRYYDLLTPVLNKFKMEDIELMLFYFHTELFKIANFRNFNRDSSFKINHKTVNADDKSKVTVSVISEEPIIASYFQISNPIQY